MDNDKNVGFGEDEATEEYPKETAPRARNRTVMLTPEVTGEVRARIAQDLEKPAPVSTRGSGFESPAAGGFSAHRESKGHQADAGRHHAPQAPVTRPGPVKEGAVWTKETPLIGILVSYDENPNGQIFELRTGRMIITSEAAGVGNFLLVNDKTVSPMHAIMRISQSGEIQVLDQLSEFGTRVIRFGSNEEEELSGDKSTLEHGDVIKFGNRSFNVCIIARGEQA